MLRTLKRTWHRGGCLGASLRVSRAGGVPSSGPALAAPRAAFIRRVRQQRNHDAFCSAFTCATPWAGAWAVAGQQPRRRDGSAAAGNRLQLEADPSRLISSCHAGDGLRISRLANMPRDAAHGARAVLGSPERGGRLRARCANNVTRAVVTVVPVQHQGCVCVTARMSETCTNPPLGGREAVASCKVTQVRRHSRGVVLQPNIQTKGRQSAVRKPIMMGRNGQSANCNEAARQRTHKRRNALLNLRAKCTEQWQQRLLTSVGVAHSASYRLAILTVSRSGEPHSA